MVPCYHLKGRFGQQLSFVEVSSLCQGLANRIGINRIVNRPPPGVPCCGSGFHGFQMRFSQERCYPRLYVACSRQLAIYAHGSTQWGLRDLNHAHSYRTNETGYSRAAVCSPLCGSIWPRLRPSSITSGGVPVVIDFLKRPLLAAHLQVNVAATMLAQGILAGTLDANDIAIRVAAVNDRAAQTAFTMRCLRAALTTCTVRGVAVHAFGKLQATLAEPVGLHRLGPLD